MDVDTRETCQQDPGLWLPSQGTLGYFFNISELLSLYLGTEMMLYLALMTALQGKCQVDHDQKVLVTASPVHSERTEQT